MESNKNAPAKRVARTTENGGNMNGWNEFWVTIRWALVIAGIVGIIFIMYQCDVSTITAQPSGLDRCFSSCDHSYSGDKEVECLAKCQNIFGDGTNQTKQGSVQINE